MLDECWAWGKSATSLLRNGVAQRKEMTHPVQFVLIAHHGTQAPDPCELPFAQMIYKRELVHHVDVRPWDRIVLCAERVCLVRNALGELPGEIYGKVVYAAAGVGEGGFR